jgi:hypothetical protein
MTPALLAQAQVGHPALRAWRAFRSGGTVPDAQVDSLKQTRKSHVYRIRCAEPDGATVIAKRGRTLIVERERRVYEQVLHRLPDIGVRYFGSFAEPGGRFSWLFIEEAVGEAYSPSLPQHRSAAAHWLARLHVNAAANSQPDWLPDRGPSHYRRRLDVIAAAITAQLSRSDWSPEEHRVLEAVFEACQAVDRRWNRVEAICAGVPATVVHGDMKRKNLRVDSGPQPLKLQAFDWANCGWAVPAVDLASSGRSAGPLGANPDLDDYHAEITSWHGGLSSSRVEALAMAGCAFRCLDVIGWELVWLAAARKSRARGDIDSWHERPLSNLRTCAEDLRLVTGSEL